MSMFASLPENHVLVTDVNERVQAGDYIYDTEDAEWYQSTTKQKGAYVSSFEAVSREGVTPSLSPTRKRILRTRVAK